MVGILGWERALNMLVLNQATKREWTIDREESERERKEEARNVFYQRTDKWNKKEGVGTRKFEFPVAASQTRANLSFPRAPRANVNLRYYRT